MNVKTSFGSFIKHHRLASGFKKQADLARVTGITTATMSRIENEIHRPDLDTVKRLAKHLNSTSYVELMVACGYWDKEELLDLDVSLVTGLDVSDISPSEVIEKISKDIKKKQYEDKKNTPQNEVEFLNSLDLTDQELKEKFDLKIDGQTLTEQETAGIIAYIRSLRQVHSKD
ncbi:hypothetical protein A8F94_17385 [Bacillus sp. FJAT-27225]|uniref:helix-turn-helix domain-containing protein n=1 Tax=Bacillus sp. FJAT-27225 TaxID=1743144 RepID=UPI00080C358A|nr:helix-turn-helix transcriptional regulator [Bacillus sp. FJAT-27225]OCA84470.1 hypothetical protein A8F94_17385 [Bacillus sp. FJAT-27225]